MGTASAEASAAGAAGAAAAAAAVAAAAVAAAAVAAAAAAVAAARGWRCACLGAILVPPRGGWRDYCRLCCGFCRCTLPSCPCPLAALASPLLFAIPCRLFGLPGLTAARTGLGAQECLGGNIKSRDKISLEALSKSGCVSLPAWKLWLLLPRMLRYRRPEQRHLSRPDWRHQFRAFHAEEWMTLLAEVAQSLPGSHEPPRAAPTPLRTPARRALSASLLAPGNQATLRDPAHRPQEAYEPIPDDVFAFRPMSSPCSPTVAGPGKVPRPALPDTLPSSCALSSTTRPPPTALLGRGVPPAIASVTKLGAAVCHLGSVQPASTCSVYSL